MLTFSPFLFSKRNPVENTFQTEMYIFNKNILHKTHIIIKSYSKFKIAMCNTEKLSPDSNRFSIKIYKRKADRSTHIYIVIDRHMID